jgi:hypothetical protein
MTLSITPDAMGVGIHSVPVIQFSDVEGSRQPACRPIQVTEWDRAIIIDYELVQGSYVYTTGDMREDGTKCVLDLRSYIIRWSFEYECFAQNYIVENWARRYVRTGASAGRIGTGLDDNEIVSITMSGGRKPDGKPRSPKRQCPFVSVSHSTTVTEITYGAFLGVALDAGKDHRVFEDYIYALVTMAESGDTYTKAEKDRAESDYFFALSKGPTASAAPVDSLLPHEMLACEIIPERVKKLCHLMEGASLQGAMHTGIQLLAPGVKGV